MTTIIRRVTEDGSENHLTLSEDVWDLRTQVEDLEEWLCSPEMNLDSSHDWIADIGFSARVNATGGGPPLTLKLMRKCLEYNVEIYLSEYGMDDSNA